MEMYSRQSEMWWEDRVRDRDQQKTMSQAQECKQQILDTDKNQGLSTNS